jgi:MoaA/NifB/PqqE/SkfB family radical SAM enzyme
MMKGADAGISAHLSWCATKTCNMDCAFCRTHDEYGSTSSVVIDTSSLVRTLDATGRTFQVNFGGGEPFTISNIVDAALELMRGHYVSLSSNMTSPRIARFAKEVDPSRVPYITASFHLGELERLGLIEDYISNFLACKDAGFRTICTLLVYPDITDKAEEYADLLARRGIVVEHMPYTGGYGGKMYPQAYTHDERRRFKWGTERLGHNFKGMVCNAGYNVCGAGPDGIVRRCTNVSERLGHVYEGIEFHDQLMRCPVEHCDWPAHAERLLYDLALKETRTMRE